MDKISPLSTAQIDGLSRTLGECGTGSDVTRYLLEKQLSDDSGESTKWRRLYFAFEKSQKELGIANQVLDFIASYLNPARFVGKSSEFESYRSQISAILSFSGLELTDRGTIIPSERAARLSEAEARLRTISSKLKGRQVHSEVLKYCRAELMEDNYFHAVFEAAKGVMQRIRDMTSIQADGASLIDKVFSVDHPILAFNSLRTQSEQSEYKGFAMLLKGCYGAVRNPMAHEPKILWNGEEDAVDYLTLISLLHRKLDSCFVVPTKP